MKNFALRGFLIFLLSVGFLTSKSVNNIPNTSVLELTERKEVNTENKTEFITVFSRASWYGPGFHGKLTANGEIYDMYGLTCAHKSLPFGTKLKVTNLKNKKSIVVRVNDRGPYKHNREIDLSKKAFTSICTIKEGIAKVKIEVLN